MVMVKMWVEEGACYYLIGAVEIPSARFMVGVFCGLWLWSVASWWQRVLAGSDRQPEHGTPRGEFLAGRHLFFGSQESEILAGGEVYRIWREEDSTHPPQKFIIGF
jgi:hypothetical protein